MERAWINLVMKCLFRNGVEMGNLVVDKKNEVNSDKNKTSEMPNSNHVSSRRKSDDKECL